MPGILGNIAGFWRELKNRRVLRSTTVYVAVAFGLLELIDIISNPLHLPDWVLTVFIFVFVAGLPVTLLLSWLYYLTPEGIRRYGRPELSDPVDVMAEKLKSVEDELKAFDKQQESKKQTGWIYGSSSFFIICLVAVLFLFYSGKSANFSERDWIILADFVNHTGEDIFEHSLNTAFEISIDQSRHINVFTRSRIQGVLQRIGKESTTKIDEELCREIAIREGINVYLIPEISRVGGQYILSAKLIDTETSDILVSEISYSKSKDEILDKLDRICSNIRRNLGESRYKISGQNKTLQKVTTSSLDALKQYSLGIEAQVMSGDLSSAVSYFENAIRLDSNFTAAKASLGNLLYQYFDEEKGKFWLNEAIESIDNLTEMERFSILAFYAANVEDNLDKSIEFTRMQLELYPDRIGSRNNLAYYLQIRGDYEESVLEYKELLRLDPYQMISYTGLIATYLRRLGEIDSALVWSEKLITVEPENGWGYFFKGSCYFALGDYEQAEVDLENANRLAPGVPLIMYRLAHTYRVLGMYNEAIVVLNSIIQLYDQEASAYYQLGVCYGMMGRTDKEEENYHLYKAFVDRWEQNNPEEASTYFSKGIVLSRLGKMEEGFEAGMKGYELDSSAHFDFASFLAVQGRTEEALDHLELSLKQGYRQIVWIKMETNMFLLWNKPRYQELLNQYFY